VRKAEPRRLTTLWAITAYYRDNFTFTFTILAIEWTFKYAKIVPK
jgi:hypothetical protein